MLMKLGELDINKMMLGLSEVSKAYLGEIQVYPNESGGYKYIETHGGVFIPNFDLTKFDRIEVDYAYLAPTTKQITHQQLIAYDTRLRLGARDPWKSKLYFSINDTDKYSMALPYDQPFAFSAVYTKNSLTLNGELVAEYDETNPTDGTYLCLFGKSPYGDKAASGTRLGEFRLYSSDGLVAHYIPVADTDNAQPGFQNLVDGSYLYPTGEVIYGEDGVIENIPMAVSFMALEEDEIETPPSSGSTAE